MTNSYDHEPIEVGEVIINETPYRLIHMRYSQDDVVPLTLPVEYDARPLRDALPDPGAQHRIGTFSQTLRRIGRPLVTAGLPDAFNGMYGHVTEGAHQTVLQSRRPPMPGAVTFDLPDKVEEMGGRFGKMYTDPIAIIAEVLETDDLRQLHRVDVGWLLTMLHPTMREANMDGVQAMCGMLVHVIRDLAMAMQASGVVLDYESDFKNVMRTIFNWTRIDLAPALVPGPFPNALKRVIARPALGFLASKRSVAWDRSLELDSAGSPEEYKLLVDAYSRDARNNIETMIKVGGAMTRMATMAGVPRPIDWQRLGLAA